MLMRSTEGLTSAWLSAALLLVGLVASPELNAQSQAVGVRYTAKQLDCARFLEDAHSDIQTESGGRRRHQTSGRQSLWRFRAAASEEDVGLEGWLDSLVVWRRSDETTIRPDTDGLLGGRYRGKLTKSGAYLGRVRPFVPDEVAEVAGMGTALDDFFPPLPSRPLKPHEVWTDSAGITVKRLPDSALSGVPLYRFELETRGETRSATVPGDSLPLRLRQLTQERGSFVWHPLLGLIHRDRRIVVQTTVPAGRSVRQAVRSKVEQRIILSRDLTSLANDQAGCRSSPS